jgi:hypothetical protein
MGTFLRENWLWILTPIILLMVALAAVLYYSSGSDGDGSFVYNIF